MGRVHPALADDLKLLGVLTGLTWLLIAVAWTRRGAGQLLWLCDVATLGTAIGLLARSRLILTAQFVGMVVYHLAWQFDFLSYLTLGSMPFSATSYMFSRELTPYEKALSFFQHTFLLPVVVWALLRLGASRYGWLFQTVQTATVLLLTYLFTRPEENINWIFGAGFASLSPASVSPVSYYLLMAALPPLFIYFPANWLVLRFALAPRVLSVRPERQTVFVLAFCSVTAFAAAAVGVVCEPDTNLPHGLLDLPVDSRSPLETVSRARQALRLLQAAYGLPGHETEVPFRSWPRDLPRFQAPDGTLGPLLLRQVTARLDPADLPRTPQELVLRGKRGRKGTVVCAIVGSDRFYPQSPCDSQTALDRFEIHCRLGAQGLEEFLDPTTGLAREPLDNQIVVGLGLQSIYAVILVEFDRGKQIARSPAYLFLRSGVYLPGDVIWSNEEGGRTAFLGDSSGF